MGVQLFLNCKKISAPQGLINCVGIINTNLTLQPIKVGNLDMVYQSLLLEESYNIFGLLWDSSGINFWICHMSGIGQNWRTADVDQVLSHHLKWTTHIYQMYWLFLHGRYGVGDFGAINEMNCHEKKRYEIIAVVSMKQKCETIPNHILYLGVLADLIRYLQTSKLEIWWLGLVHE